MPISLDVFVSPYKPVTGVLPRPDSDGKPMPLARVFPSSGEREAVLVDSLITTSETEQLVDWIRAKNKNVTTFYITHGHGDHFFGLNTAEELIDRMMQLHGERGNPFTLWVAADGVRAQLGGASVTA